MRLMRPVARLFHAIAVKDYEWQPGASDRGVDYYEESARRFLGRIGPHADPRGKQALDVGTGSGELAAVLARDGAARVVGIDIEVDPGTVDRLTEHYGADVMERVELVTTRGDLGELGGEQFDLVFSKEAMEHYPDPEAFVPLMAAHVKPGGSLVVGFGPLWKSFDGGHMSFMTKFPWAHLLFPEDVIMAERRRFRPDEEARRFEEIRGGLNRMTLARFEAIIAATGFEPVYVKRNAGDHPAVKAMDVLARARPLREYFTNNVYGVWRRPAR
jgi:SAM-dependent methyltransferase